MKKVSINLIGIVFVMTAMVSLMGCADKIYIMQPSSSEVSSISPDNAGEDNSAISSSELAQNLKEGTYDEYVNQLGYLLNSPDWKTVTAISPTDYVMWYA